MNTHKTSHGTGARRLRAAVSLFLPVLFGGCNLAPTGGDYFEPSAAEGGAVPGRVNYQTGPKEAWHLQKAGADIYIIARKHGGQAIRFSLELNDKSAAPALAGDAFTVTIDGQPHTIKDFKVERMGDYMRGRHWGDGWHWLEASFVLPLTDAQCKTLEKGFALRCPPVTIDDEKYALPVVTFKPGFDLWVTPLQY